MLPLLSFVSLYYTKVFLTLPFLYTLLKLFEN